MAGAVEDLIGERSAAEVHGFAHRTVTVRVEGGRWRCMGASALSGCFDAPAVAHGWGARQLVLRRIVK